MVLSVSRVLLDKSEHSTSASHRMTGEKENTTRDWFSNIRLISCLNQQWRCSYLFLSPNYRVPYSTGCRFIAYITNTLSRRKTPWTSVAGSSLRMLDGTASRSTPSVRRKWNALTWMTSRQTETSCSNTSKITSLHFAQSNRINSYRDRISLLAITKSCSCSSTFSCRFSCRATSGASLYGSHSGSAGSLASPSISHNWTSRTARITSSAVDHMTKDKVQLITLQWCFYRLARGECAIRISWLISI